MMATAMESLHDSVLITDVSPDRACEGPVVCYANDRFEKMTGWVKWEIIGKSINILDSASNEVPLDVILAETIETGRDYHGERQTYAKPGEDILCEWNICAVRHPEGEISQLVFIMRDISHIRRLEENIRDSQKIEAMGRLAGGIAHDFNNLLSVINSYSDLLTIKLDNSETSMKYVKQIKAAGLRGADLVSKLMTFSRRETPSQNDIDLASVTEEIKNMLQRVIREDIELETVFEPDIQFIKADRGQMEQVLMNLCVNARDAMPDGGKIVIRVSNRTMEEVDLSHFPDFRPGNYVVLTVEDTGCGMNNETKKHIFDPFFTTKEVGKGTGLGLSTVYGIVRQSGGHIEVISAPDEGTRFEIYLPAVTKPTCHPNCEKEVNSFSNGTEKVLVVEDDETFADCIGGLLKLHGYEVYTASNGAEALQKYAEYAREIKLLISDIVLPRMSGRELATQLLEINPRIKVLFMTGYDDKLDTEFSLGVEAIVLKKPFSLNSILTKVREILDSELIPS